MHIYPLLAMVTFIDMASRVSTRTPFLMASWHRQELEDSTALVNLSQFQWGQGSPRRREFHDQVFLCFSQTNADFNLVSSSFHPDGIGAFLTAKANGTHLFPTLPKITPEI